MTGGKPKLQLTGKEVEMGSVLVDLAKYAKDRESTEKLYLNETKDMYIEISVSSKPMDAIVAAQANAVAASVPPLAPNPLKRGVTKTEPKTEEDYQLVQEFKEREHNYNTKIKELKNSKKIL